MSTTRPITPSPRGAATPSNDARRHAREPAPEPLTMTEMLGEVLPLVGVVVVAGPPAIVVIAFFALLALTMCGAFLLIVTYVLVAASVLALAGAALVMPYLLVRQLAGRWAGRAQPAMRPVALEPPRAVA